MSTRSARRQPPADAGEKVHYVVVADSSEWRGDHCEPIVDRVAQVAPATFAAAVVLVPNQGPDHSEAVRQTWAVLCHLFHHLVENSDSVVFLPKGEPSNVVALRGLAQAEDIQRFFIPLIPFPRLHFYTAIPSGLCAPRPHRRPSAALRVAAPPPPDAPARSARICALSALYASVCFHLP